MVSERPFNGARDENPTHHVRPRESLSRLVLKAPPNSVSDVLQSYWWDSELRNSSKVHADLETGDFERFGAEQQTNILVNFRDIPSFPLAWLDNPWVSHTARKFCEKLHLNITLGIHNCAD